MTLEDPEEMIAAQHVVPVIRPDALSGEAIDILNQLSVSLSTEELMRMNALNSGDDVQEPATIAADWLEENGLN